MYKTKFYKYKTKFYKYKAKFYKYKTKFYKYKTKFYKYEKLSRDFWHYFSASRQNQIFSQIQLSNVLF